MHQSHDHHECHGGDGATIMMSGDASTFVTATVATATKMIADTLMIATTLTLATMLMTIDVVHDAYPMCIFMP